MDFKSKSTTKTLIDRKQLLAKYESFVNKHSNIVSIEDPFDQDDWEGWNSITKSLGSKVQIVGDYLLVNNLKRIEMAAK